MPEYSSAQRLLFLGIDGKASKKKCASVWQTFTNSKSIGRKSMIKIHLSSETAIMPRLGTEGAAGYDLFSDEEDFQLMPRDRVAVPTGVTLEMWPSVVGIIKPRSGLAVKNGIEVLAGVIDSDYRGEVKVVLINLGGDPVVIKRGQAIAQILFMPVLHGVTLGDGNLSETARGGDGFGSTDRVE